MKRKKMGVADKFIFVLGLILCGVVAVALVVGVMVAVLKWLMDDHSDAISIHSVPRLEPTDDTFEPKLVGAAFERNDESG